MDQALEQAKAPRVSIVSAVDDHPPDLNLWFGAFDRQTLGAEDYEAIVVDATHQVDYQAALRRYRAETRGGANITCHRVARGGRARALNSALEHARSDLVIFLGDDNLPPPGFAEAHLRFHEEHPEVEAVGVSAAILVPAVRTPFSVWLEESGELYGAPFRADMTELPERFFYVANASVKRELLDRAGRFDERFAHHAWDDYELGERLLAAGMKTYFVTGARTAHIHGISLRDRERTLRQAGAAAKLYSLNHSGQGQWLRVVRKPSWRHWLRVIASRVRLAATGSDEALVRWWKARLDAALAAGYRNGA